MHKNETPWVITGFMLKLSYNIDRILFSQQLLSESHKEGLKRSESVPKTCFVRFRQPRLPKTKFYQYVAQEDRKGAF